MKSKKQTVQFSLMGLWLIFSIAVYIMKNGLDSAAWTRIAILVFFCLSLGWYFWKGRRITVSNPARLFILWSVANAMVGEICYMISKPLHESLLVTIDMPWSQIFRNVGIDLILTLPAYLIIFSIVWKLVVRYGYTPFSFFFLVGLGQSLGDGNTFFWVNPGTLILIPYVMLNYWAMSFVPYLAIRPTLKIFNNSLLSYILPIVVLPITYFFVAAVILTFGKWIGWLPA